MLDIGWTELMVIAVVAILVVGPKDLPRMLRAFGQTMGQLRRSANEFKRQFDDALREAEREADFEDARKSVQSIGRMNPLADLKQSIETDIETGKATAKPAPVKPVAADPGAAAKGDGQAVHAPVKAAGAGQAEAGSAKAAAEPPRERRDSDAA